MSQEELALKQRLEENRIEMSRQEWLLFDTLENVYEKGLYKEYANIMRITKAMIRITERKKNIYHEFEELRKNMKK